MAVQLQRALRKAISELDDALEAGGETTGESQRSFHVSFGKPSNRDLGAVEAGGGVLRQCSPDCDRSNSVRGRFMVNIPTWGAGKVAITEGGVP